MLSKTNYTEKLKLAVSSGVKPETIIYLLKNQLIDASIFNHNLKRIICFLTWKLKIEESNEQLNLGIIKVLETEVSSLEKLMQNHSETRNQWQAQLEKFDYNIMCLAEILDSWKSNKDNATSNNPQFKKNIRRVSIVRRGTMKNLDTLNQFLNLVNSPRPLNSSHDEIPVAENYKIANDTGLKKELERLEEDLRETRIEMEYHKTMEELFVSELKNTRVKLDEMNKQVQEVRVTAEQSIRNENKNWQLMSDSLRQNYDMELARKQEEIIALHSQMAEWIIKYIELEKGKPTEVRALSKLLKEYG